MAVSAYTGTLPNPRTQQPTDLNDNMDDFINWLVENAVEISGHVSELVALASVSDYSATASYAPYDCVYGTDGHTYRCIQACSAVSPGVTSGWESYWYALSIEPGPDLASGVLFTGDIQGGNYYRASATTVTIEAGRCVDDTDKYWIEWAEQTISITKTGAFGTTHIWACSDGVIREDEDVDGTNLDYVKRYLGRITMDSAGTSIAEFRQNGDLYTIVDSADAPRTGNLTVTSFVDQSTFLGNQDPERIAEIEFGTAASSSAVVDASYDGTNSAFVIGTAGSSTASTHADCWGAAAAQSGGFKPCPLDGTIYFRVSTGSAYVLVRSIRMKR